jgi:hypothetical protein
MSSHQMDPRSMSEATSVSNFAPGMQPRYMQRESAWVVWVQFAGLMLVLDGTFHVIQGLVALFRDEVFVATRRHLVVDLDYTTWGWIQLAVGAVVILVGVGLLSGRMVARVLGAAVAFVSALVSLTFLPAYPVWSVMMITLDVVVMWAIIVHGAELRPVEEP